MNGVTRDGVGRGFIHVWQPAKGYRFNLDSVLLAAMCAGHAREGSLVVDAGAGTGVVGLYVAKASGARVMLVERQAEVARLAQRGVEDNALDRVHVVRGDFRALPVRDGAVDVLACNPPFARPGTGKVSPDVVKRLSKEAVHGGAQEVLDEAGRVLSPRGVLVMVMPAKEHARLTTSLSPRRLLRLAPEEGAAPDRVLCAWMRERGEAREETRPVHAADRSFQPWVADILEGRSRALR